MPKKQGVDAKMEGAREEKKSPVKGDEEVKVTKRKDMSLPVLSGFRVGMIWWQVGLTQTVVNRVGMMPTPIAWLILYGMSERILRHRK